MQDAVFVTENGSDGRFKMKNETFSVDARSEAHNPDHQSTGVEFTSNLSSNDAPDMKPCPCMT